MSSGLSHEKADEPTVSSLPTALQENRRRLTTAVPYIWGAVNWWAQVGNPGGFAKKVKKIVGSLRQSVNLQLSKNMARNISAHLYTCPAFQGELRITRTQAWRVNF